MTHEHSSNTERAVPELKMSATEVAGRLAEQEQALDDLSRITVDLANMVLALTGRAATANAGDRDKIVEMRERAVLSIRLLLGEAEARRRDLATLPMPNSPGAEGMQ